MNVFRRRRRRSLSLCDIPPCGGEDGWQRDCVLKEEGVREGGREGGREDLLSMPRRMMRFALGMKVVGKWWG